MIVNKYKSDDKTGEIYNVPTYQYSEVKKNYKDALFMVTQTQCLIYTKIISLKQFVALDRKTSHKGSFFKLRCIHPLKEE